MKSKSLAALLLIFSLFSISSITFGMDQGWEGADLEAQDDANGTHDFLVDEMDDQYPDADEEFEGVSYQEEPGDDYEDVIEDDENMND